MSLKNLSVKIKIPKVLKNKLNNRKIHQIYKKFAKSISINENFIVAVSGGPDSLALAFLSKIYSIQKNLKVKFYIVDHKLRADSTIEANNIKRQLKKFDINCSILTWKHNNNFSNIQSKARDERYKLIFEECLKKKN